MSVRSGLKAALVRVLAVAMALLVGVSLLSAPAPEAVAQPTPPVEEAPIGEIPQQESGSAEGLSHSAPIEDTRVSADDLPPAHGQLPAGDAPPAEGGVGPDVPVAPVPSSEPEQAPTTVAIGAPEVPAAPTGLVARRSVEDVDRRGSRSQVFDNPDGTKTLRLYEGPAFYRDADGDFERIRPDLIPDARGWRSEATATPMRLGATADAATLASLQLDRETSVGFRAAGVSAAAGMQFGDAVVYEGARPNADLELQVLPSGVKETIVLRSADVPLVWDFPLSLQGLTAAVVDGGVQLTDDRGTVRAVIPPGWMEDSAVDPASGSGAISHAVRYDLVGSTLRVSLDPEWVTDPARVFPVRVDPSVLQVGASGSTFVQKPYTNDYSGQVNMSVGTFNGGADIAAAYLKFDSVYAHLAGNYVLGAKRSLTRFHGHLF